MPPPLIPLDADAAARGDRDGVADWLREHHQPPVRTHAGSPARNCRATAIGAGRRSLDARRFQLGVVAVFAALAVLPAAIGVYGMMAYSVAQRRVELGVRLALGAAPRSVLMLVLGRAVRLGVGGLVLAVPLAWLAGSALRSFLYGVTPLDPAAFTVTVLVMFSVAVGAAALPAIRASRLDPGSAFRHE